VRSGLVAGAEAQQGQEGSQEDVFNDPRKSESLLNRMMGQDFSAASLQPLKSPDSTQRMLPVAGISAGDG
jgi:hypothetical protein